MLLKQPISGLFNGSEYKKDVYDTLTTSLLISTAGIIGLDNFFQCRYRQIYRPHQIIRNISHLAAVIIGLDAISALPFAKLRNENRPKKFACHPYFRYSDQYWRRLFFSDDLSAYNQKQPNSILHLIYSTSFGVAYVLIANIAQASFSIPCSLERTGAARLKINIKLWKEVWIYALPLTIAGFAGMINETFDRVMLQRWSPLKGDAATFEVGVYSACYKFSILITLFVQAFRMGAEPFFFKQSTEENAPRVYARVMKFFVITICGNVFIRFPLSRYMESILYRMKKCGPVLKWFRSYCWPICSWVYILICPSGIGCHAKPRLVHISH